MPPRVEPEHRGRGRSRRMHGSGQSSHEAEQWAAANEFFQRAMTEIDYVDRSTRHNPPRYAGSTDPSVLDEWVYRMRRVFMAISCPDEQRVWVATNYLEGDALDWWRTREDDPTFEQERDWEEFVEALRGYFYPPQVIEAKEEEFRQLRQTMEMSVTEYYHRFMSLMRHGVHLVPTTEKKVKKFVRGLRPAVRACYGAVDYPSVSVAYEHALFAEETAKELGGEMSERHSGQNREQEARVGSELIPQEREQISMMVGQSVGSRTDSGRSFSSIRSRKCHQCGEKGHLMRDCPATGIGPNVASTSVAQQEMSETSRVQCYECHGWGHRQRYCPVRRTKSYSGMDTGRTVGRGRGRESGNSGGSRQRQAGSERT